MDGPAKTPASVQFATKIAYKLNDRFAVGVESYDGAGDFKHFGRFDGAGHEVYGAVDATFGKWALNAGLGFGSSGEPDHWTRMMIVSVRIDD